MIYAYLRVSSDKQTASHQRSLIETRGYKIDKWLVDEAISGTIDWKTRGIYKAVKNGGQGDRIIVAEISRLGRSLKQILEIIEICQKKGIVIVCIRESIELSDDNPMTKLLVSIMGSLAELERNLISQRTKDALAHKREMGVILGRPKGTSTVGHHKLFGKDKIITELLSYGNSFSSIAKSLKVNRTTLHRYYVLMTENYTYDKNLPLPREFCHLTRIDDMRKSVREVKKKLKDEDGTNNSIK